MNKLKTLYFSDRKKWRNWLENNFDKEKGIWFVFPKISSGKARVKYNDAVEEALCFGWIDSTVKTLDDKHYIQRFTPRRTKSNYSQPNKERIKWLSKEKMLHPSVEKKVKNIINEKFVFPDDILNSIKKDKIAWENFENFSDSYKRIRIAYIDSVREHPEEFNKRLSNFIKKTKENKLISGFGGIDKYY